MLRCRQTVALERRQRVGQQLGDQVVLERGGYGRSAIAQGASFTKNGGAGP
jgi:hypothetical protein